MIWKNLGFFNLKCRARSKQELPRCPRNVISDDYRFIPLRRRKFEVIRVLDHDFRGHQSWEDQYFENVGSVFWKSISFVKDLVDLLTCHESTRFLKEHLPNIENRIYQGMEHLVPPLQVGSGNGRAGSKFGSGNAVECHFDAKKDLDQKYSFKKKLSWKTFFQKHIFR